MPGQEQNQGSGGQKRGGRDRESTMQRQEIRKYLLLLLGLVVIGALVWFLFLLPGVSAENEMKAQCSNLCREIQNNTGVIQDSKAVEYCTRAFKLGGSEKVKGEKDNYCSNGAHCFNRYECKYQEREIDVDVCISVLYNYYREFNEEDRQTAAQHVVDIYKPSNNQTGVGTCELEEGWYQDKLETPSDVLEVVGE